MEPMPCSWMRRSRSARAAAPISDHAPQLMLSPHSPSSPAVVGEGVEVRVGGGVIALAGRAEQRGHRREQNEEIEIVVTRERVQMPGAGDLRRHHAGEARPVLLEEHAVVELASGVHDAAHGSQDGARLGESAPDVGGGRDVALDDAHLGALTSERLDRGRRLGAGCPTAHQEQRPCASLRQPARHREPESTEAAGDEVARRPVGSPESARRAASPSTVTTTLPMWRA